jgi:predicted PilT family ATPase
MANETKLVVCCGGCEPKCGKCGEPQWVEMTNEEIAQRELERSNAEIERAEREAALEAELQAKSNAVAKLLALGLTEEEVNALVK